MAVLVVRRNGWWWILFRPQEVQVLVFIAYVVYSVTKSAELLSCELYRYFACILARTTNDVVELASTSC